MSATVVCACGWRQPVVVAATLTVPAHRIPVTASWSPDPCPGIPDARALVMWEANAARVEAADHMRRANDCADRAARLDAVLSKVAP